MSGSSAKKGAEDVPPHQQLPRQLGKYLLLERLGYGGMAEVYLAKVVGASGFEKRVAVKCLLPLHAADDEFRKLFEYEARLSSQLDHPNIVTVHDFLVLESTYVLAMEYIDGKNLSDVVGRLRAAGLRLHEEYTLYIVSEILRALEYAHSLKDPRTGQSLNIVHRDVTPKNIMLTSEGRVKLLDFGIAKVRDRSNVTKTGTLRGTVQYMAPEQIAIKPIDGRTDLFSAGAVLFELLTGETLFPTDVPKAIKVISDFEVQREMLEAKGVPPLFQDVLMKALSRAPEARYERAQLFLNDLQRLVKKLHYGNTEEKIKVFLPRVFSMPYDKSDLKGDSVTPTPESGVKLASARPMSPDSLANFEIEPAPEIRSDSSLSPIPTAAPVPAPTAAEMFQGNGPRKRERSPIAPSVIFVKLRASAAEVTPAATSVPLHQRLGNEMRGRNWSRPRPKGVHRLMLMGVVLFIWAMVWWSGHFSDTGTARRSTAGAGKCFVNLLSYPAGAHITMDGRELPGITPLAVTVPCGETVVFSLYHPDYGSICRGIKAAKREHELAIHFHSFPLNLMESMRTWWSGCPLTSK